MQTPGHKDEVSFKDLLLIFKRWIAFLFTKWLFIVIVGIIGGVLGLLYALFAKPKYEAELVFVLSNGSSSSGLAGLAGQFGIDLSSGSGTDAFQGDNIMELFKSRNIVKRALFRPLEGKSDILINLLARESKLAESWEKKERLRGSFPFKGGINEERGLQDSLFRELYEIVLKKYLFIEKVDKKLNFYSVASKSSDETLSIELTRNLVNEAAAFYIETKTKTARANLKMMQHESDSLRYLLGNAINSTAFATDQTFNLNAALETSRTPVRKNQVQAEVLGTAYGEVVKNLEIAKITLQKETPLFQIIDYPEAPLKKIRKSKSIHLVLGGVVFSFLYMCFLLFREWYRKNMPKKTVIDNL
jgi:sulfopyruvate decarboxylase TPP-binding subunit